MMKLLNRDYPAPVRALCAMLAFGLTLAITGRSDLAHELSRQCWKHKNYKTAARRGAWYARRGWPNIEVVTDDFFDPTEGMQDHQLASLTQFLKARRTKLAPAIYAADMAIIAARRLNNNTDPCQRNANISAFQTACNDLLQQEAPTQPKAATTAPPRVGDFPIANAQETLADFAALFPVQRLHWFVISGTFLGLIRENGFLAHDYDIDLGVFEDDIDIPATIATIATSDRFVLKKYDHHESTLFHPKTPTSNPDVPYILKLVHMTGVHIDLFIHYRDTSTTPAIDWHGSSLHRWENSAFDLIPYPFYDQTVLGPKDADRYLRENYGDWRTPVTDFNCTTDTPNLTLVPHPIAVALFLRRYVFTRLTKPKQAAKLEAELLQSGFLERNANGAIVFSGALFSA